MRPSWLTLKVVYYCYIMLVLFHQALDSFMASILFLGTSLPWGTEELLILRATSRSEVSHTENELSFGQILALLLLLEPLSLVVEYSARKG